MLPVIFFCENLQLLPDDICHYHKKQIFGSRLLELDQVSKIILYKYRSALIIIQDVLFTLVKKSRQRKKMAHCKTFFFILLLVILMYKRKLKSMLMTDTEQLQTEFSFFSPSSTTFFFSIILSQINQAERDRTEHY